MEKTFTAIGRAVISAQLFETALIPIFEVYKMLSSPEYLEKTEGRLSVGSFKIPVKNIVKILSENGDISESLESEINLYIENRHKLIHRWVVENGPPEVEFENIELMCLADSVTRQANSLTKQIAGYMVKYADPSWAISNMAEFEEKMLSIFRHQDKAEE